MNDLISRQVAINLAKDLMIPGMDYLQHNQAIMNYEAELVRLPSVEPEQRWISVSERLPEPRTAVLGYAPKYQNIYALYYDSVRGWMVWNPIRDDYFPNSQGKIVAWTPMPTMPEPYQEEPT